MIQNKRIVCLANSRKLSGRCIAGREWDAGRGAGAWIRPVSERKGQEVSEYERQYEDGSDPRLLDILDIPVKGPRPDGCQSENWLLDPEHYWRRVGSCSPFDLPVLADPVAPLWVDGDSTYHGRSDRVSIEAGGRTHTSLRLVKVEQLTLRVFAPGEAFGNAKRRVQGRFKHAGHYYALWVTDPVYERQFLARLNGTYQHGECYLTVSLGEPYEGYIYKLIAAIIKSDGQ